MGGMGGDEGSLGGAYSNNSTLSAAFVDHRPFPDLQFQSTRVSGPPSRAQGHFSLGQLQTNFPPLPQDPVYTAPIPEGIRFRNPATQGLALRHLIPGSGGLTPHAPQRGLATLQTPIEFGGLTEIATRPVDEAQRAGDPWSTQWGYVFISHCSQML